MPVAFESIKVWPHIATATAEPAQSIAKGVLKGVRGLSAHLVLVGAGQKPMLEAKNILLIASDQNAQTLTEKNGPYTRMVWKPEFCSLNDAAAAQLFPPVTLDESAVIPSLNNLALYQLAHFRATNPQIFQNGTQVRAFHSVPKRSACLWHYGTVSMLWKSRPRHRTNNLEHFSHFD